LLFYLLTMNLRQTWQRKFRAVLTYLENLHTPIARKTFKLIRTGKVVVLGFKKITLEDCKELHEELCNDEFATTFSKKRVLDEANNRFKGMLYQNRIYIREDETDIDDIAKTIAHEVNHFLNNSNDHYETEIDKFTEELRATIAEDLLSENIALTPCYLREKSKMIIENYKLDLKPRCLSKAIKEKVIQGLRY